MNAWVVMYHSRLPSRHSKDQIIYKYTANLCALEGVVKSHCPSQQVDSRLWPVTTQLKVNEWVRLLAYHPDRAFVNYILSVIQEGFLHRLQATQQAALSQPQHVFSPRRWCKCTSTPKCTIDNRSIVGIGNAYTQCIA